MSTKKKSGLLSLAVAVIVRLSVANTPAVHLPQRRAAKTPKETKQTKSSKGQVVRPLWPDYVRSQVALRTPRPTNTTEATQLQWVKSNEPCVPTLGEPWIYKGERGIDSSVTLYFTPASGLIPGSLSAIEVDYYGYLETNLIGKYFSEERVSKDGTYHSLAVALRDSDKEDLCAADEKRDPDKKYVMIAPGLANEEVPLTTASKKLRKEWQEGACILGQGYHWLKDTVGGKDLTYKAANTVPVVPMYDDNGDFAAIFFLATDAKQNWADSCSVEAPTPECIGALNFWDPGPGLNEENKPPFRICANVCGDCQFTGSGSDPGKYTTMHWWFVDPASPLMQCAGNDRIPFCSSGEYPSDILWPDYVRSQVALYTPRPTNTTEASQLQWVKSNEPCVSTLGEPWIYKGERGIDSSVTLYFTPAHRYTPGTLSAIEVDYYGYLETNLIGKYFSEERVSKDGTYHSLAVALRDSNKEDLCAADEKRYPGDKYVMIAPGLANEVVPLSTSSNVLGERWQEGACILGQGYHWLQDTVGGKNLTHKAANTVPVVLMYDDNGDFAAIFFLATDAKQNWADSCSVEAPTPECIGALNFWDPGPGLNEENKPPFRICANVCGDCQFTGSGSDPGMYTSMHWWFVDPASPLMQCAGNDRIPFCSSGEYPTESLFV